MKKNVEIVGRKIEIEEAGNKSIEGICGIVINETKNLLMLKTEKGIKKIIKNQIKKIKIE